MKKSAHIHSGRIFAMKNAGAVVCCSDEYAYKHKLVTNPPIGRVVGYRKAEYGSGYTVAIDYHGHQQSRLFLARTREYSPTIEDPPSYRNGLYFVSTSEIQLYEKIDPPKAYPMVCPVCNSPGRKGVKLFICSNRACKKNKELFKAIGPIPKYSPLKNGFLICERCSSQSLMFASHDNKRIVCSDCGCEFNHNWKNGHKVKYRGISILVYNDGKFIEDKTIKGTKIQSKPSTYGGTATTWVTFNYTVT